MPFPQPVGQFGRFSSYRGALLRPRTGAQTVLGRRLRIRRPTNEVEHRWRARDDVEPRFEGLSRPPSKWKDLVRSNLQTAMAAEKEKIA